MPDHSHSQSSPDMPSMAQPQLPSQRMAVQNPFEQDEVEPSETGRVRAPGGTKAAPVSGIEALGVVPANRAKNSGAMTG